MLHQQNIKTFLSCHYSSSCLCHSARQRRGPSLWCVMSRSDDEPRNEHSHNSDNGGSQIFYRCVPEGANTRGSSVAPAYEFIYLLFVSLTGLFSPLLCNSLWMKGSSCDFSYPLDLMFSWVCLKDNIDGGDTLSYILPANASASNPKKTGADKWNVSRWNQ